MSDSPTPHAQPFYCPYCGETDIRPGDEERQYRCSVCGRVWELRFVRLST